MNELRGRVCVFTGSSAGVRSEYAEAARRVGRLLVERGYGLVYGGGNVGLMAVVADAVLERKGHVIGGGDSRSLYRQRGRAPGSVGIEDCKVYA